MKKLFLLFSHKLTPKQILDAKDNLGIEEFVELPQNLQALWSNIPPHLQNLNDYLLPLKYYIKENAKNGDIFLIQGDFGGCCEMVNFVKSLGFVAVHATTKRDSKEEIIDGKVVKTSHFEHVIFRRY